MYYITTHGRGKNCTLWKSIFGKVFTWFPQTAAITPYLTDNERSDLRDLVEYLVQEQKHQVLQVILFGSAMRDDRGEDSDVDLLILIQSEDWRDHEPIRYLAASLSNQYDIFLSPEVMGIKHFQRLKRVQPLLYQNICTDGVELFRSGKHRGMAKVSRVWIAEPDKV